MSQPRPAVPDPTQIAGRYDVVQKLGAGAFGTVFKAKDKLLGRMVAIKTIRLEGLAAQGAGLEELIKRFKVEATISAQLKHPNIVTIYDVGESDGMSYLAMEFIDGVGLDRLIATQGRLPAERAALIAAQVADALDFAHRHGVVHRDIKPANIMIESGDRVKVTDFGIAKATDSGEHLTVTGSLLGTPSYMSPEQAKGAMLDGRSDLFAVGCVLYEMLAGKKAFRGDSITGLIFKIITEEPPPITEIDPLIPEAMVRIVQKALSKAPEARYQSGRALADDLLALTRSGTQWPTLRQGETPTAVIPPAPTLASTVAASGQGVPPTVATTPTVATSAAPAPARAAASPKPSPPPPPPPRPAPPPARGGMGGLLLVAGVGLVLVAIAAGVLGWYFVKGRGEKAESRSTTVEPTAAPTSEPPAITEAPTEAPTSAAVPTSEPAATLPPTTARTPTSVDASTPKPAVAAATADPAPASDDYAYLDDEGAARPDGVAAGDRLARAYGGDRSTRFGASRPLNRRPLSPPSLKNRSERAAVATLRHIIHAQAAFHKREGRYGSLGDLIGARFAHLDVRPAGNSFERAGYRFELTVKDDGFEAIAFPQSLGLRPFKGDDSEFIIVGVD